MLKLSKFEYCSVSTWGSIFVFTGTCYNLSQMVQQQIFTHKYEGVHGTDISHKTFYVWVF